MINRTMTYDVMPEIQKRWSPRALDPNRPVPEEEMMAILEAARFAPSCFNEQPWEFIVGNGGPDRDKIFRALTEKNQAWAHLAPALLVILAKSTFAHKGKDNRWHQFDTGTAWGYLTLEAQRRGLQTHGMAGFKRDELREAFAIPDDYSIIAVVAVGYYGKKEDLIPSDQEREAPAPRKPLEELIFNRKREETP